MRPGGEYQYGMRRGSFSPPVGIFAGAYFACFVAFFPSYGKTQPRPQGAFDGLWRWGREKVLASAGHMTTKHPEFVGVLN